MRPAKAGALSEEQTDHRDSQFEIIAAILPEAPGFVSSQRAQPEIHKIRSEPCRKRKGAAEATAGVGQGERACEGGGA